MRGYFGVGVEGISKPMNLGALLRTAHAFGASFSFTIAGAVDAHEMGHADTSDALSSMPFHRFAALDDLALPMGCRLVGVELLDEATDLPSFTHPQRAAYVLGAERSSLSPALVEHCDFIVRIPTKFCINLAVAGALVMYDRMLSLGRFAERPVRAGGPAAPRTRQGHGPPIWVKRQRQRERAGKA
jgi:tRNA G18 (ribose-2'-O)-methylase SpoU